MITSNARRALACAFAIAGGVTLAMPQPALAQDGKLPATMTFTAYETGSSGFNIAVTIGKVLKDKHGSDVRVLPAGNDVARHGPLKVGRAHASVTGIGSYFGQEGVFEFASRDWGPQPMQMLLASVDCNNLSIGIAKDIGIQSIKELKGKRVAAVVGSPALNQNMRALLAFGGLTLEDVKVSEFASYAASWKGLVNNEIDAAVASNISGQAKEAETSPRGVFYPVMPHADTEGWARVAKFGPYFFRHKATCGTSASKEAPLETSSYPYPIIVVYASQSDDLVHALTKALIESYPEYKDAVPGASGLDPKTQNFQWVLPVHPAAVRAFKAAGVWKDADQAHNDKLLLRQKTLADAWSAYLKTNPPEDKEAFRKGWMSARKAALEAVKMEAIFE